MRHWLCCARNFDEAHHHYESHSLKSTNNYVDGMQKGSKPASIAKDVLEKKELVIEVPKLYFKELKEKTDNFGSNSLVGEGSYGRVYFAALSRGQQVAIKKLDGSSDPEYNNQEFLNQIATVSKLKHENFVELLGYCVEEDYRLVL